MMDLVTLVLACSLYANNSITYAMVQTGSANDALTVSTRNETKHFKTESDAIAYTEKQITLAKNPHIGLMQISSKWLTAVDAGTAELFRPCKNLVVATQLMNQLSLQCQNLATHSKKFNMQKCMLSRYKASNPQAGEVYANQILNYAKNHPFGPLVAKARDPGMLAAVEKPIKSTKDTARPLLINSPSKTT
jgi:hypothetical protein